MTRGHVGKLAEQQQRGDLPHAVFAPTGDLEIVGGVRAVLHRLDEFLGRSGNAAAAELDTQTFRGDIATGESGITHCQAGGGNAQLDGTRHHLQKFLLADELTRVEIMDLCGQLGWKILVRKGAQETDPATTSDEVLPELVFADPNRRNDSDSGHNDPLGIVPSHHLQPTSLGP